MVNIIVSTELCKLPSYLFKCVFICIWLLGERVHITGCQPSDDANLDEEEKRKQNYEASVSNHTRLFKSHFLPKMSHSIGK